MLWNRLISTRFEEKGPLVFEETDLYVLYEWSRHLEEEMLEDLKILGFFPIRMAVGGCMRFVEDMDRPSKPTCFKGMDQIFFGVSMVHFGLFHFRNLDACEFGSIEVHIACNPLPRFIALNILNTEGFKST